MKKALLLVIALLVLTSGCARRVAPLVWSPVTEASEKEYEPFLANGSGMISGQAFLTQRNGGVVKAAGRTVTLDPKTTTGNDWWWKAGRTWMRRFLSPPSQNFIKARRTVVADADGRFKFAGVPDGTYYLRTEVTWEVGGYVPTQGGLLGAEVVVQDGKPVEIILQRIL